MADDNRTPPNGSDKEPGANNWMKSLLIWAGILLALVLVVQLVGGGTPPAGSTIAYSDFLKKVDEGQVKQVDRRQGSDLRPARPTARPSAPSGSPATPPPTEQLRAQNVQIQGQAEQQTSVWLILLYQSLPFLLILGIAFFVMRQMQKNAGSGAMGFGNSKAKLLTEKHGRVTFDDVAGIDEAREELQEIVEFLKDPTKFARLGGKIPKGALLVGSPGTGKTLLARAIAGEANVPFFTISGSDFVEMFVGVGASPRARHVRAGQEERALHRLHRRDRRGRPPSRRRPRQRQ